MVVKKRESRSERKMLYSLWLPIQSNAKGGDLNAMLGVIVVLGVNAASQQTLLLSLAPHPIQC